MSPRVQTCQSCGGLGYAHRQKIFDDGYELDKEQKCLLCHGTGYESGKMMHG